MYSRNGMYFISCTMNFSDAFRLQVVVTTIVEELKNWPKNGEVRDNCRAKNDKDHSDRLERAINISFCWTFTVTFVYKYILVCCFFCLKTVTYIIVYYCSIPSAIKIEQRGGINIVKIVRFITLYRII